MRRRYLPLNWVQWLSLLTSVAVAVVMPFLVIGIDNAHRDTDNTLHHLLCYFETRTIGNPQLTGAKKRQAIQVYNAALAQIAEPPCTPAAKATP